MLLPTYDDMLKFLNLMLSDIFDVWNNINIIVTIKYNVIT